MLEVHLKSASGLPAQDVCCIKHGHPSINAEPSTCQGHGHIMQSRTLEVFV